MSQKIKLVICPESDSDRQERDAFLCIAHLLGNKFPKPGESYDVSLTVDGVEIPFSTLVANLWEIIYSGYDRDLADRFHGEMNTCKLRGLVQKIEEMIVDEIRERTGVNINSDGDDD